MPLTTRTAIDRERAIEWYTKNRARTARLFDLLTDDAYYAQPIALRHPIVFYEGHLPAFSLNTLVKKALGRGGIDEGLERLFARGIDPDDAPGAGGHGITSWPSREAVRAFADAADALVLDALQRADIEQPGHPLLERAQAVYTILEHEAMHQETLLYMWQQLPHRQKRAPKDYAVVTTATSPAQADVVEIPTGRAVLGAPRGKIEFGWDNEFGAMQVDVPAFRIDRLNVTNGDFLAFVEAGGYARPDLWSPDDWEWVNTQRMAHPIFWKAIEGAWHWCGMFGFLPLPLEWPVYVSQAEASAFARWRGARLPSEAEYHRAAFATPDGDDRYYPWGNETPRRDHGVFDFQSWEPQPVGSHPAGRSAWGVDDLMGNGWEWTNTLFGPFPGFEPHASYPEYSADFFDQAHYVMKGASPATARELLRPTLRNWFRPRYPYVYATFRCVREARR